MSNPREFEIQLPGGIRLSGAELGKSVGEPLLLLHGYGDSWKAYLPLMRALPASMRTIAVTLRGHGESAKPAGPYGTEVMARDIVKLMDSLAIRRATIVGHSMGSLVAQRLAQEHAARVDRLVLIGAFSTLKGHVEVEALWRDVVSMMTDPVDPEFVRDFQMSTLARPIPQRFLADVIAESLKVPAHVWRGALDALRREDRSVLLHKIAAETLIIWGDRDTYSRRADLLRLAHNIARARLVVHAGTGHCPHWEDPARAAADIAGFVARVDALHTKELAS